MILQSQIYANKKDTQENIDNHYTNRKFNKYYIFILRLFLNLTQTIYITHIQVYKLQLILLIIFIGILYISAKYLIFS